VRKPGKVIGGSTYLHASAIVGGPFEVAVFRAALKLPEAFRWTVAKVNEATGAITFTRSPDFDTADEPRVGDAVRVDKAGELHAQAAQDDPWIYHHKWQMVREDYAGFDVAESRARSAAWGELDVDRSRIGRLSYWTEHVLPRLAEPVAAELRAEAAQGDAEDEAHVRAELVNALRLGLPGFLTAADPEDADALAVTIRTGEPAGPFRGLSQVPVGVLELMPVQELKRLEAARHLFWVPLELDLVEQAKARAAALVTGLGGEPEHTHAYSDGAEVTGSTDGHTHNLTPAAELTDPAGEDDHVHTRDPAETTEAASEPSADGVEGAIREEVAPLSADERRDLMLLSGSNTAKARDSLSAPMRFYSEAGLLKGEVLDFGCGKDPHAFARYDPAHDPDPAPLQRTWDTVTCNYVLNVLPLEGLRTNVMLSLRALVAEGGQALVSVWQRSPEAETFRTSRGYQCGWSREDWETFLGKFWTAERLKAPGDVWSWRLTHPERSSAPLGKGA